MSLADLQRISEMENGNLEFELPDLEKCSIKINENNLIEWTNFFKKIIESGDTKKLKLHTDDNKPGCYYLDINTVEQLQFINKYINFKNYSNSYRGWFEYSMPVEETQSDNILWAENKSQRDGTRFGIKVNEDKMFKIAMNRGNTFVYLDSGTELHNTLEEFLGKDDIRNERDYETDSEYDNDY